MAKRMSDEEFMGTQEKFFDRLKEDLLDWWFMEY